jgi:hypothetical protein
VRADLDTLVIALYVPIDELLGPRRGPGRKPKLSDAELVCLAVAQVLLGYDSERRWLRFAGQRLGHLFPYLPTASAYNRRLRLARPPGQRPAASERLTELARAYGLPVHPEHDPLHDALTTAQLFLALATRLERHGRGTLGALRRLAGRTSSARPAVPSRGSCRRRS